MCWDMKCFLCSSPKNLGVTASRRWPWLSWGTDILCHKRHSGYIQFDALQSLAWRCVIHPDNYHWETQKVVPLCCKIPSLRHSFFPNHSWSAILELWLLYQLNKKVISGDFKKDHAKPDTEFTFTKWSLVLYLTFLAFIKWGTPYLLSLRWLFFPICSGDLAHNVVSQRQSLSNHRNNFP